MNKCILCEVDFISNRQNVLFRHRGISFEVYESGRWCRNCIEKIWKEKIDRHSCLLSLDAAGLHVDWKLVTEYRTALLFRTFFMEMLDILLSAGIFSEESKGNWAICLPNGEHEMPSDNYYVDLYFTRKEDVEEYAKLACENHVRAVKIP